MMLEKIGKYREYNFCIEGVTECGYPFAETGCITTSSFDAAVLAVQGRMTDRNEMRAEHGLSGRYTEITELTMVKRDIDEK